MSHDRVCRRTIEQALHDKNPAVREHLFLKDFYAVDGGEGGIATIRQ